MIRSSLQVKLKYFFFNWKNLHKFKGKKNKKYQVNREIIFSCHSILFLLLNTPKKVRVNTKQLLICPERRVGLVKFLATEYHSLCRCLYNSQGYRDQGIFRGFLVEDSLKLLQPLKNNLTFSFNTKIKTIWSISHLLSTALRAKSLLVYIVISMKLYYLIKNFCMRHDLFFL